MEIIYQGSLKSHDFKPQFQDNMADSMYADLDKLQWKSMLKRRLSNDLRRALIIVYNVLQDYYEFFWHTFVNFFPKFSRSEPQWLFNSIQSQPTQPNLAFHLGLTIWQGGSSMHLDTFSHLRALEGRLTELVKDARHALGRCIRSNKPGYVFRNCPLDTPTTSLAATELPLETENLKNDFKIKPPNGVSRSWTRGHLGNSQTSLYVCKI